MIPESEGPYARALGRLGDLARFGMRPGLDTIERLLGRLGNPEARLPAIHIAGTNGKGSTAAFAASLLHYAGAKVGLYTSPHLARFTERIRVQGVEIAPERCAEVVERALAAADEEGLEATFFEIATAAALLAFAEAGVEIAVLECGLGGRLDATNACRPRVSAITTIGHDHMEVLGDTLEKVAAEKAGIARPGVPLVVGAIEGGPLAVIEARAAEVGAPLWRLGRELMATTMTDRRGRLRIAYQGPGGPIEGGRLSLAGAHQADNAALALAAVGLAGYSLPSPKRRRALSNTRWPGRLEEFPWGVRLDGAHNAEGAAALARALAGDPEVTLLIGLLADKEAEAIVRALLPVAARVVCTRPPSPRALPPEELAALWRRLSPALQVEVAENPRLALRNLAARGGRVVVCGSLYLVGALRPQLSGEPVDPHPVADPLKSLAGPPMEVRKLEGGPTGR